MIAHAPKLPLFLQPDKLSELNRRLFAQTGCFAFLKTDPVLCATAPSSWQDAFSIILPGLYSVYHDYGCGFLRMLMDSRFLPPDMYRYGSGLAHIHDIEKTLRPNIVHGVLFPEQRQKLVVKVTSYCSNAAIGQRPYFHPDSFTEFLDQMTEQDWEYAVETIGSQADGLYRYLENWGKKWAANPDGLSELKVRFAADNRFMGSFDDRVCRPIVEDALRQINEDTRSVYDYLKLDRKAPDPNAPILRWRARLKNSFLERSLDSDSLYQELVRIIRMEICPSDETTSLELAGRYGFIL